MPSRTIPEREPIGDPFTGFVFDFHNRQFLSEHLPLSGRVIAEGHLTIRYGIRYLGKNHISIVPGLVALDYGAMLTGEKAFDFVVHKSNLHPRADVVGYRNDGTDEMVVVKALDLAVPLAVLVYKEVADVLPIASVEALIGKTKQVSARLHEYLPQFDTLQAWEEQHDND